MGNNMQFVISRYKPLLGKWFDHQRHNGKSDFPQLADGRVHGVEASEHDREFAEAISHSRWVTGTPALKWATAGKWTAFRIVCSVDLYWFHTQPQYIYVWVSKGQF